MNFACGFRPRTSVLVHSAAFVFSLVACGAFDDPAPPPQQMGNGYGQGGQPERGFGGGGVSSGAGGVPLAGGVTGAGGIIGGGGVAGPGGQRGVGGAPATGGVMETGGVSGGDPESGRLVGMTAAHNAVRMSVQTQDRPPPVTWSPTIAAYAQEWADSLAASSCASPHHRRGSELQRNGYGENLAAFSRSGGGSSAQEAVDGWASESACWTYGAITTTERCDPRCYSRLNSDGCGHYTQIVWRATTEIGCGVASCQSGPYKTDIWICNYKPPGNFKGQVPY